MSCFLSRSCTDLCGNSRGISGIISLLQCNDSIESHLASIQLSRETITERQPILARAGLFDLDESVIAQMSVCAKHRHTYGKQSGDPEQPVSIQHIKGVLVGARKGQRADIQWILKWLKLYIKCMVFLFKSVQVGTTNSDFLTHLLLHTTGVKTFYRFSFQNSSPQF